MVKFIIILFALISAGLIIYLLIDHSQAAAIERRRKLNNARTSIKKKVVTPVSDFVTDSAKSEKVVKVEKRFKTAGIKMSYSAVVFISFATSVILFFLAWKLTDNIYLGIVGAVGGYNIPTLVAGILSNRRIEQLEEPINAFLKMTIERYKSLNSFRKAFLSTIPEMRRDEFFYRELLVSAKALEAHEPMADALFDLSERCDNIYLWRFADLYRICVKQGTKESIEVTLMQVVKDYDRHLKDKRLLKRQLNSVTMQNKLMLAVVPVVLIYCFNSDPSYAGFYISTTPGKITIAAILGIWLICIWVTIFKLGAPLDKEEKK